jgi:hypothetical protein
MRSPVVILPLISQCLVSRVIPVGPIPSANPTSPTARLAAGQRVLMEEVRWLL